MLGSLVSLAAWCVEPALCNGTYHGMALRSDGRVFSWGRDSQGQLGLGRDPAAGTNQTTPSLIPGLSGVTAIACGIDTSYALRDDGAVMAWGSNSRGGLGVSGTAPQSTPAPVAGLPPIAKIVATNVGDHALAIDREGRLWAWGSNEYGQLGDGLREPRRAPAVVRGLPPIAAAAAGGGHSVAVSAPGEVFAWGLNRHGQLGDGTLFDRLQPVVIPSLTAIGAVAAGAEFSLALTNAGNVQSWGNGSLGQLGRDLDIFPSSVPGAIPGLERVRRIDASVYRGYAILEGGELRGWGVGFFYSMGDGSQANIASSPIRIETGASVIAMAAAAYHATVLASEGPALAWGENLQAAIGDGTFADRPTAVLVVDEEGAGYLNLAPERLFSVPPSRLPAFGVVAKGSVATVVTANMKFNAEDVGSIGSVYVFAWAPATIVKRLPGAKVDAPAGCVLAQLTGAGQLQQVSASGLQAYISGALTAQGQAVAVMNGTSTVNIAGATFYVGYGASPAAMLASGNNRSVVSIDATTCKPQPPQKGWWWNPAEPGRGFSIEVSGNRLFFAAYMYDSSGRSTWYVSSGRTSLDGSLFGEAMSEYANGQTLSGPYRAPTATGVGSLALAFSDATRGTLILPGTQGPIPIERFNIVPRGLAAPAAANQPESGWWWDEQESGRGYYIEWQGGSAFLAGYMYDEKGKPIWYVSQAATPNAQSFQGTWIQYGGGQTLGGQARTASVVNGNVAPVAIRFQGQDSAFITLPGRQESPIKRFRF